MRITMSPNSRRWLASRPPPWLMVLAPHSRNRSERVRLQIKLIHQRTARSGWAAAGPVPTTLMHQRLQIGRHAEQAVERVDVLGAVPTVAAGRSP